MPPVSNPSQDVTVTRKQLQGHGLSRYLAKRLTETLLPLAKEKNAFVYSLSAVLSSITVYQSRKRIHQKTRNQLEQVYQALIPQINTIIEVPFGQSGQDPALKELCLKAISTKKSLDRKFSEAWALSAKMMGAVVSNG